MLAKVYRDTLFVYGGKSVRDKMGYVYKKNDRIPQNQVLSLTCAQNKLEQKSKLSFDFYSGSCTSNNQQIMLCFPGNANKQCFKSKYPVPISWWEWFTLAEESLFEHSRTNVAMSSGKSIFGDYII